MWRHKFTSAAYAVAFLLNDRLKGQYVEWDNPTLQLLISSMIYVLWFLIAFENYLNENGFSPARTIRARLLFIAILGSLLASALIIVLICYAGVKRLSPALTNGAYPPEVATFCVLVIFIAILSYFGGALSTVVVFGRVSITKAKELGRLSFGYSFARILSLAILIFVLTFRIISPMRDAIPAGIESIVDSNRLDLTFTDGLNFLSSLTDVFLQCAAAIVLSRVFVQQKN